MLEGQRAFHSLFCSRARVLNGRKPPTEEELARMGGAMHPVVITHPDTGRKCLFISDQVVDHFDGWTIEESKPLLDFIYAHASQPALTYRHAWRPGDIIFWDNRCTQHYTPVDYRSEEHTSELQSLMRISYAVFCLKNKNTSP